MKAFILCAGFGTRLKPLTQRLPKPLIPLLGKPLLSYILDKISQLSIIKEYGFNLHHLSHKLEEYLLAHPLSKGFHLFYEKEILGTGGALVGARSFLEDTSFMVYNGDIYTDADLSEAIEFHLKHRPLATLLTVDNPKANRLIIDELGRLKGLSDDSTKSGVYKSLGFSGIALYEREIFNFLPEGPSSVVEAWLSALSVGETILTFPLNGPWFDIGTPAGYLRCVFHLLKKEGENFFIHPKARVESRKLKGFVTIETEAFVKKRASLENVVVLAENSEINGSYKNGLLLKEGFIPVPIEDLFPSFSTGYPIGNGGSDRRFYRLGSSRVKMKGSDDLSDFERTISYNRYFYSKGLSVPKILKVDSENREVLFRDLGDLSLYNYMKMEGSERARIKIYKKVIDEMIKLHALHLEGSPPSFPYFDYEHFRWESRYFQEKFLDFLCSLKWDSLLDGELDSLAKEAHCYPKNLIHRDFQSQNVIIHGNRVYLIDYQGARIGPPGYDLVSLLYDPYVFIHSDVRSLLVDYYVNRRKEIDETFDERLFYESLPVMRIQRHLQALGAYVNLAFFRGKKHFLKFIPTALRYLKEDLEVRPLHYLGLCIGEAERVLRKRGFFERH